MFFNQFRELDRYGAHLPHWVQHSVPVFVTWRLADSIPQQKLKQWTRERALWIAQYPKPWPPEMEKAYHARFSDCLDVWLDRGMGGCILRRSELSNIVAAALLHFHTKRYWMLSYVVMPNHVHVLFVPHGDHGLSKTLGGWKGYTAKEINRVENRRGTLWQSNFWDRLIRSPEHFQRVVRYIRENPENAKLSKGEYARWEEGLAGFDLA